MEYKQRKRLRLQYYDYSQEGAYFITICTRERINVLSEIKDGQIVLSEYGEVVKNVLEYMRTHLKGMTIDRYVIMPNHIHMILIIDDNEKTDIQINKRQNMKISKMISYFKRYVNSQIGFSLFQRSYNDHIIRNEKEYLEYYKYIENNPLAWENDDTM